MWSVDDGEYVGLCDEFPSLSWKAPTPDEAFSGIRQLVDDFIAETSDQNDDDSQSSQSKRNREQEESDGAFGCGCLVTLLVVFGILAWVVLDRCVFDSEDPSPADSAASPTVTRDATPLDHTVVEVEDLSIATARRFCYRIQFPSKYSQFQAKDIATSIVEDYMNNAAFVDVNAICFFFYYPDSDPYGLANGSMTWAPDGDWAKADSVRAGDYRSFRLVTDFYDRRSE